MGLFSAAFKLVKGIGKKLTVKGTFAGKLFGATRKKGTNIFGLPKKGTTMSTVKQAIQSAPVEINGGGTAPDDKKIPTTYIIYGLIALGVTGIIYFVTKKIMAISIKDKYGNSAKIQDGKVYLNGKLQSGSWRRIFIDQGILRGVMSNGGIYGYAKTYWKYSGKQDVLLNPAKSTTGAISGSRSQAVVTDPITPTKTSVADFLGGSIKFGSGTETMDVIKWVIGGAVVIGILGYTFVFRKQKKTTLKI